MHARTILCLAALAWAGCATEDDLGDDQGGGKADGECKDATYGDGVCQVDLECGIPDIDCFETFATDADAATWIAGLAGVSTLPESDALYTRARALTDRAWAEYTAANHLGKLADARVSVVVIPNDVINAWVTGSVDQTKAALSVHFHSAILAPELTDEEILGVVFHELAHITKLHVLPEVHEMRRYYVASGAEPIGALQADDARVRPYVEAWTEIAGFAGAYSRRELVDLPYGGNLGALFTWLLQTHQASCPAQVEAAYVLLEDLGKSHSDLDDDVVVDAAKGAQITSVLDALGACVRANTPISINQLFAGDAEWNEYLRSVLPADQHWLLDEQDGITALQILADDQREKLRTTTQKFERELGVPWTAARYFSTEEEADDVSVRVSKTQKYAAPGVSLLMQRVMTDPTPCNQAIASGSVPYGVRLDDTHHGTCWRIAHAHQLANGADTTARRRTAEVSRGPWTPTRPSDGTPMY